MSAVANPTGSAVRRYKGRQLTIDGKFELQGYVFQVDESSRPDFDPTVLYRFAGPMPKSPGVYLIEKLNPDRTGTGIYLKCRIVSTPSAQSAAAASSTPAPAERPDSALIYLDSNKEFVYAGVRYRVVPGQQFAASLSRPYRIVRRGDQVYIVEIVNGAESRNILLCEPVKARPSVPPVQSAPSPRPTAPQVRTQAAASSSAARQAATPGRTSLPQGAFFVDREGRFEVRGRKMRILADELKALDLTLPFIFRGRHPEEPGVYVIEQLTATGELQTPRNLVYCIEYQEVSTAPSEPVERPTGMRGWLRWVKNTAKETMAHVFERNEETVDEVSVRLPLAVVRARLQEARIPLAPGRSLMQNGDVVTIPVLHRHRWAVDLVMKLPKGAQISQYLKGVRWNTGEERMREVRRILQARRIPFVEYRNREGRYYVSVPAERKDEALRYLAALPDA